MDKALRLDMGKKTQSLPETAVKMPEHAERPHLSAKAGLGYTEKSLLISLKIHTWQLCSHMMHRKNTANIAADILADLPLHGCE